MTIPIEASGSRQAEPIPWMVWLAAPVILFGFGALESHALRPGVGARPPAHIEAADEGPRMLVFLHPLCPCSRATLTELERIARRTEGRVSMRAYVLADEAPHEASSESDLWRRAASIPGMAVEADFRGQHAREFGVETSGTVLLYARDGTLLFDGGITASRGHEGENDATAALVERISSGAGERFEYPVFGCALSSAPDEGSR